MQISPILFPILTISIYDTMLYGDGSNLSQGQQQLIAIARAAIAKPPVLILDEATSSIDTRTERLIEKGMDGIMEGRTVFVIAHRLSTIQNADVILVMQDGHIIEQGNHENLLKKNGFYCFIHKSELGTLSMLNGGAFYKLRIQRLKYYYANMDRMIESIKKPLDKYSEYQQNISNEIKKIGGSGRIHGCIIDIDSYNHVYVNPVNMIVTGYYALDIINKKVYGNIPELLKTNCPKLYCNYMKMIEKDDVLILNKKKNEVSKLPQEYLETDIYKASREMKNMQKISYNVLSVWYDSILDENIFDIQ